ncbi:hypothetical protein [Xylanibacter ruminicola]|uniref:Uncharacterized protein n=1 Tax=Xylanibacter ruminicola TaxID=839 RepID=A0A1M6UGA7_XYLRU|nr:hypothetical protein [Xylanibacter ruminicola]SHK68200.1 hypothetical protein SAMN05216463_10949 [Xylanibacter ruminicola]
MKKKRSLSGIVFSKTQLNMDAVLSFISDLKPVDKISKEDRIAASKPTPKPIMPEPKKPETYFKAVDEYCDFMEQFVPKRGNMIVEKLKKKL